MNPAVLDAFALVIAAASEQAVYPGIPHLSCPHAARGGTTEIQKEIIARNPALAPGRAGG